MRGVYTALITPFKKDGSLDLEAYHKILEDQCDARVHGVVPCGTTGESSSLTIEEKKTLIKTAIEVARPRGLKVIAGTGSNNSAETVEFSRWASTQGVDGILVVTPYYNKPSQAGLEAHYQAIADAVDCEVLLYNVPGRTGISLQPETIARLAKHPKIKTLKEATGNVAFTCEILDVLSRAGQRMDLLSGDDATYLPMLSIGAVGVISVASNLFPRAMVEIAAKFAQGQVAEAQALHRRFYPLFRDLFIESNPGPIKRAMALTGFCEPTVRLPLVELSSGHESQLLSTLASCGVKRGESL